MDVFSISFILKLLSVQLFALSVRWLLPSYLLLLSQPFRRCAFHQVLVDAINLPAISNWTLFIIFFHYSCSSDHIWGSFVESLLAFFSYCVCRFHSKYTLPSQVNEHAFTMSGNSQTIAKLLSPWKESILLHRLNKCLSSKLPSGYILSTSRRRQRPKLCANNNKDEENSRYANNDNALS